MDIILNSICLFYVVGSHWNCPIQVIPTSTLWHEIPSDVQGLH